MEKEKNIFDHFSKKERPTLESSYFINLTNLIVEQNPIQYSKAIPFYKKRSFVFSTIASIAAVVIVFFLIPFESNIKLAQQGKNELTNNELIAYVDDHIDEFEEDLIMNSNSLDKHFTKVDLKSNSIQENYIKKEVLFDEVNRDDVMQYLENQEINLNDLEDVE